MKLINGSNLELDLSDPELAEHFNNPYNYTKEIIEQFDHDIYKGIVTEEDKIILDLGANSGLFALHVLPYVKEIYCVEPTPEHMSVQKKLVTGNPKVTHVQAAINSYTGKANFHRCGINTTMNSLHHQNREQGFEVDCYTLADLLRMLSLPHVDLCKIDIEGGEDFAITTDLLKACNGRIKKILIELHPGNRESQDKFKLIFEAAGFNVEYYTHESLICIYGNQK